MGILCLGVAQMCEHCERKHDLSNWAQEVAFKKERLNKEVCAAISAISLKVTPPPFGN